MIRCLLCQKYYLWCIPSLQLMIIWMIIWMLDEQVDLIHLVQIGKFRGFNGLHWKQFPYGTGCAAGSCTAEAQSSSLLWSVKFPYGSSLPLQVDHFQYGRLGLQCAGEKGINRATTVWRAICRRGILWSRYPPPIPSPFVHSTPLCPSHVPVRQKSRC